MRPALAALGLALAGATTAACSTSGSASVAQDPIPTATPTPSPTPSPTAAADQHTLAGSEAFVRRYITETNHAYATGDVAWLKERSAAGCKTCANLIRTVQEAYAGGGKIVGSVQRIHEVQSLTAALRSPQQVGLILSAPEAKVLSANGTLVERLPGAPKTSLVVTLQWNSNHWLVAAVGEFRG